MVAGTSTSTRTKRVLLLSAAAAFFIWENIAMGRWLAEHESVGAGLAHAWATLRQDTLVLLVWTDMGVFSLVVLAWLLRDMAVRGLSRARRAAWLLITLVLGCPALLTYLAFRPRTSDIAKDRETWPSFSKASP